jgi:hypothetical protein
MKFFIYNCFFLLIVLIFAYVNTVNHMEEAFTPKVRELYRPYSRNLRLMSEGFYNKHTTALSNLFRKFKII